MTSALKKITDVLTVIMKACMIVLFIWMVVALGIQVVARYGFQKNFVWSEESARYCMIWLVYIGATEIIFKDEHIKVTIIEDLLKGIGKKILLLIQDVICLIFSILLIIYSIPQYQLSTKAVSSNMNINMGIVFAIFPVVTSLMALGYLFKIVLWFAERVSGPKLESGGGRQ